MDIQMCKGMRDWLPPDMHKFRFLEDTFRSTCQRWGYEEIRTPTLEYLHLFTASGTLTPQMLGRVYSFLDWDGWSGERVVLRPDGTIPAARLFLSQKEFPAPAKLFYVQNVFSFEETGREPRERWQCGVELLGSAEPAADVELILLGLEVLHRMNLSGVEVSLSHLGLVRALLKEMGRGEEEVTEALDRVLEGDGRALVEQAATPEAGQALSLLMEGKGTSPGFLGNLKALLAPLFPGAVPSLDNFLKVAEILAAAGCPYSIDMAAGKGFEYYTGVAFQFRLGQRKVGAGGRYDELLPLLGGKPVPASGFALYAEPLLAALDMAPLGAEHRILVHRGAAGDWNLGFALAEELRAAGYIAEIDLGGDQALRSCWMVSLPQGAQGKFVVWDRMNDRRLQRDTVAEVLQTLEELGAAKASPA